MLAALGVLGVLVAGFALPMAFGDDDDTDERDEADPGDMTAPTEAEETDADSSPLDVALAPENDDGAAPATEAGESAGDPAADMARESMPGIRLDGSVEDDALLGTNGDDDIGGGFGDDTLVGDGGDDLLFGADGDDSLLGGEGDDHLADGDGDDTLLGGEGDDTLSATPADGAASADGRDVLDGGAGDDTLILSAQDHATGGAGADTFLLGPGLSPLGLGDAAQITDYDPAQDSIVVVWNDFAADTPPEISVAIAAEDAQMTAILADGIEIAHLPGAADLDAARIELMRASQIGTGGA